MRYSAPGRFWAFSIAATVLIASLFQVTVTGSRAEPTEQPSTLTPGPSPGGRGEKEKLSPTEKAKALGIKLGKVEPKYLNHCVKTGKLLFTSGFGSKTKGRLGKDLDIEGGRKAARECAIEILQAVYDRHGTLDNLRVVKVLGCVNSTPDFYDQPKVMNGCSDLFHEIYGAKTDGWHARSALGFASLPNGCAVEIEAIFEIKD